MSTKQVEKGSFIFQENDPADGAYLVVSGKVALLKNDHGQLQAFKAINEQEIFGELGVFAPNTTRPYAAQAQENCTLELITPEELTAALEKMSKPLQAVLALAFDKMKLGRSRATPTGNTANNSTLKRISILPVGEKMKTRFKPVEITPARLPYRIGGFPEGGETNRRETANLLIASETNPLRISRQHCEITFENDTLVLVDLGSRLCTTVNGVTVGRGRGVYSAPLNVGVNKIILGGAENGYTLNITCE